jgi:hypothetical protein
VPRLPVPAKWTLVHLSLMHNVGRAILPAAGF